MRMSQILVLYLTYARLSGINLPHLLPNMWLSDVPNRHSHLYSSIHGRPSRYIQPKILSRQETTRMPLLKLLCSSYDFQTSTLSHTSWFFREQNSASLHAFIAGIACFAYTVHITSVWLSVFEILLAPLVSLPRQYRFSHKSTMHLHRQIQAKACIVPLQHLQSSASQLVDWLSCWIIAESN